MTRLSPSCQQLITERYDEALGKLKIIVKSCLADRDLAPVVMNHKCNDCILTPSGLNCDMAYTLANYLYRSRKGENAALPGIKLYDLEVHKPLIVRDIKEISQLWIEMEATIDLPEGADVMDSKIKCLFYSISPDGVRLQECGYCYLQFEPYNEWLAQWKNYTHIVTDRIQKLYTRACKEDSQDVQLVQRAGAYKLFESFVQYSTKYQNMSEVAFDTKTNEAVAVVDLLHLDPNTDFTGPYYLDASCHISGFVCNAVEPDKDKNAFVSHGVKCVRLSPEFRPDDVAKSTTVSPVSTNTTTVTGPSVPSPAFRPDHRGIVTYVQMRASPTEKSVMQGDVFVLQDEEIVGVWEGVSFKKIPRKVLNVFLPPPKRYVSRSQAVNH